MRNKGAITLLVILLTIVSVYQLSFSLVTYIEEKAATKYANGDEEKERAYLDSISNQVVYNLLGMAKFTYKECKEQELPLGLDLRGGMNVTLEVDVAEVLKSLSNHSQDEVFNRAIEDAIKMRTASTKDFVTLFGEAFNKIDPKAQLASPAIFGNQNLKTQLKGNSSNAEVLNVVRGMADAAIDNTFNILRTRIDRFGVAQPNIRKAEISGRINIELPGIKDAQRVRKLLQGTASLEFFETYDNSEFYSYLVTINEKYRDIEKAKSAAAKEAAKGDKEDAGNSDDALLKSETKPKSAETLADLTADMTESEGDLASQLESDTLSGLSELDNFRQENPFFYLLNPAVDREGQLGKGSAIGYANVKDIDKINAILQLPQVKSVLPRGARLLWEMKNNGDIVTLHAIKTGHNGQAPLDGSVVIDARKSFDQQSGGSPVVSMNMNGEGTKIWARLTKDNIGHCIAIVLDDLVVSSPTVNSEIKGGSSQISGNFDVKEAEDLANILKSGKLPAPARIIADEIVGPSLGQESIQAGLWSFIIAFILILAYMFFYYSAKGAGMATNIALLANTFFTFGILASLGAVLTLPGIAGIVLTMGMAIDANVLINERVEEERRAGKGLKLAIKDGYNNAYSAIIDGNLTTLLTGFILYYFGEGPIKGFATTLIIGICTSLFSSIFISRLIVERATKKNENLPFVSKMSANWLREVNISFLSMRKYFYAIVTVLVVVSLGFIFTKGFDQGIDFVGGRTYTVRFDQDVAVEDVAQSLAEKYGSAPEVKTFGGANQARITTKYKIAEEGVEVDDEVETLLYEGLAQYIPAGTTKEVFLDKYRQRSEKVGPAVAEDITRAAYWSVLFALIGMFLYIMVRFSKWQYAAGAVVGLTQNVIIVLGVYSAFAGLLPFSLEIDQSFIAAILTVVGYSINDTVVIFDRAREHFKLYPKRDEGEVTDAALNITLRRTLNTSLSTLAVLLAIFIFGGASLRGFIFALLIGITVGTCSSIAVATPIAYDLKRRFKKKAVKVG
ncbi:protein translocase subunit SecDF [Bacteroidia bacterium]|nr:protein translocase subunit SecDF [Bacteroidia bacterium]